MSVYEVLISYWWGLIYSAINSIALFNSIMQYITDDKAYNNFWGFDYITSECLR